MKFLKNNIYLIFILCIYILFYLPVLTKYQVPIPTDTIVGLYHPYRDVFQKEFPNGVPFKNFLITDPIRQTYIWKELAIDQLTNFKLPIWNPYEMTGKPLLANFQTGAFYPLNIIFIIPDFPIAWSIFIIIQTFLTGLFFFIYMWVLKIEKSAATVGSIAFAFSGFSVSWLEWGNVVQTVLWLPLVLFSIEKVYDGAFSNSKTKWYLLLLLSLVCSFFAGHLQTFFYSYMLVFAYFLFRWFFSDRDIKVFLKFLFIQLLFLFLTFFQWFPTLQFINLSARGIDQSYKLTEGWFLPFEHLWQFMIPDFFGNPTTLNYFGKWNYAEFIGYIGVLPLMMAFYSLFKVNRTIVFYLVVIITSLIFALPTPIAKIPYDLNLPFISSAQPTRLIFVISFSLCVLASYGFNELLKSKKVKLNLMTLFTGFGIAFSLIYIFTSLKLVPFIKGDQNYIISNRNILFPILIFLLSFISIISYKFLNRKKIAFKIITFLILILVSIDLIRFATKFETFSERKYLYPNSKILSYLQKQKGEFRVGILDNMILPPNFLTHYKIQTIEGYDPLYLISYAEYVVAMERNSLDVKPPFGFNRIITPHNYTSSMFDLLNTKYVLSLTDIKSEKLNLIINEGETRLYLNNKAFERVFFVNKVISTKNVIGEMFKTDLSSIAVTDDNGFKMTDLSIGSALIEEYSENRVKIRTYNTGDGFLVLTDAYYPTWKVYIDGKKSKIYKVDHAFRGVLVPKGRHLVEFKVVLF